MSKLDRRKSLTQAQIDAQVVRSIDRLLNDQHKRNIEPWVLDASRRANALRVLQIEENIGTKDFAEKVGLGMRVRADSVGWLTRRTFMSGGREILRAILERLKELEPKK